VRLLLEKDADMKAKHSYGWTPLLNATQNGHKAVVRPLLERALPSCG
jgi:ankyrin repeat protein